MKLKNIIKNWILVNAVFLTGNLWAQDTIRINIREAENLFLQKNLSLIAEKMNISIADAEITQAKMWENPTLSISDVNLWATEYQRNALQDAVPNAPNYTQFSVELSQLITTAGKRRKNVAVQKVSKEIATQQFSETLRGLKTELRKSINEIIYFQKYETVLAEQVEVLAKLINAYEKQVRDGNLSKAELLRLQLSSLEIENELQQLRIELNSQLKTLKSLLYLPPTANVIIVSDADYKNTILPALHDMYLLATDNRPDIQLQKLQTDFFAKTLQLEKAQRIPDITVSANYDRYAGLWKNYIGFGVSFSLPFFNRNQGNIKMARLGMEQSKYLEQQVQNDVFNEISEAYSNYEQSLKFYRKMLNNALLAELDKMLDVYAKNLLNRNISMLEFIDFMESYQKSKQIFLETQKSVNNNFEELQYVIGMDI
jgi:cobalt-zinc-cadmium efflux system outer membrane protein